MHPKTELQKKKKKSSHLILSKVKEQREINNLSIAIYVNMLYNSLLVTIHSFGIGRSKLCLISPYQNEIVFLQTSEIISASVIISAVVLMD